jgi:hypothetical protein
MQLEHLNAFLFFNNGGLNRPEVTVTDKAYGRTANFKPLHTEVELQLLAPADQIGVAERDKWHRQPFLSVEDSFN